MPLILFCGLVVGSGGVASTRGPQTGAYRRMDTRTLLSAPRTAGAPIPLRRGAEAIHSTPRSDSLPEFHTYLDNGCWVHPTCLRCPLPSCIYDAPSHGLNPRTYVRSRFVHYALTRHVASQIIARYLRLSPRTVYRLAQQSRHAHGAPRQARLGSLDPLPSTIRREPLPVT